MNRHQLKGILISLLFVALGFLLGMIGIDLGRFFWIAMVLLIGIGALYFTGWVAIRALRRGR